MLICKKCNSSFPYIVMIDNKKRNLQRRKYCLKCSPFKSHNTTKLEEINETNGKRICISCGKNFSIKNEKKKGLKCQSCYANARRRKIKQKCINYLGGKCSFCGYNKCPGALVFHHVDPQTKEFSISGNHCRKWKTVKEELDKCILLCSNCHNELHYKG